MLNAYAPCGEGIWSRRVGSGYVTTYLFSWQLALGSVKYLRADRCNILQATNDKPYQRACLGVLACSGSKSSVYVHPFLSLWMASMCARKIWHGKRVHLMARSYIIYLVSLIIYPMSCIIYHTSYVAYHRCISCRSMNLREMQKLSNLSSFFCSQGWFELMFTGGFATCSFCWVIDPMP